MEEFYPILWLMYAGEENLWYKIREGYIKSKALKNMRLVNGLLKYTNRRVYVLQGKLRLLVWEKNYDTSIARHKEK